MSDLTSARARPRKTSACVLCRTRKVKCSGEIPCKGCLSRGVECVVTYGKKRGPPIGYVRTGKETKGIRSPAISQSSLVVSAATVQNNVIDWGNIIPKEQGDFVTQTSIESVLSSVKKQEWTQADFYQATIQDQDEGRLPFVDYYFKWVHRLVPFFSKSWLESNFNKIPLFLLHSMFALALATPLKNCKMEEGERKTLYEISYNYAKNFLFVQLDSVDPFAVCGLIQLTYAAGAFDQFSEFSVFWSMAMSWACQLGFPLDLSPTWKMATHEDISDINFCRSMWFMMYTYGYQGVILFDLPIPETPDISDATIKDFVMPNRDDAYNISENSLSFYSKHLPLVTIGRKVNRLLMQHEPVSDEQTNEMLALLNDWYADLPIMYKVFNNDYTWMGRYLANLNMLYYYQRLILLKSRFLAAIEAMIASKVMVITDPDVIECIACATAITTINQAFILNKPAGIEDQSYVHKMFLYHSALYHCCAAAATGDVYTMIPIVSIHIEAIKMIDRGPGFEKLQECFDNPILAMDFLKRFKHCRDF